MATLIIGSGLVGSQIARLEVEAGRVPTILERSPQPDALGEIVDLDRIRLIEGSVLEPSDLLRVLEESKITRIVHTAANPLLTAGAQKDPYPSVQLNIMGSVNVYEAARRCPMKRVVLCSSAVLYHYLEGGDDQQVGLFREEALPRTATIYSTTKQAAENLGLNYSRLFGIDLVAVRFSAVFGPWKGEGGGGAPTNLIRNLLEQGLNGKPSTIAARQMELLYSKDAAQGAFKACFADRPKSRVFNIGPGRVYEAEEIVEAVRRVIPGAQIEVEGNRDSSGHVDMSKAMDLTRAKDELGYQPEFSLEEALRDQVETYR